MTDVTPETSVELLLGYDVLTRRTKNALLASRTLSYADLYLKFTSNFVWTDIRKVGPLVQREIVLWTAAVINTIGPPEIPQKVFATDCPHCGHPIQIVKL